MSLTDQFLEDCDSLEIHVISRNEEQLVRCYYILEDYDSLENLVDQLQSGDSLLPKVNKYIIWI